jgi:RNA polymerase sigma-70 factor (ECF subfamily)
MLNEYNNLYEIALLKELKFGNKTAFSTIFSVYYTDLVMFATTFIRNMDSSEEIVQEVFVTIWENHSNLDINISLKSYLLKIVQNKCLDWLRHLKVRDNYSHLILQNPDIFENDTENYILYSELEKKIEHILQQMPDEFATAFKMNRYEGLKYTEIAEKLHVSVRTIEVRISKALVFFRDELKDYLITIAAFLFSFFN